MSLSAQPSWSRGLPQTLPAHREHWAHSNTCQPCVGGSKSLATTLTSGGQTLAGFATSSHSRLAPGFCPCALSQVLHPQPGACSPQVRLSGSVSSQYLTALLMAAPLATGGEGIDIQITDELVSQPYVDMTVKLMERFGVKVSARVMQSKWLLPAHWQLKRKACAECRDLLYS